MKNTVKNIAIATSLSTALLLSTVSFAKSDSYHDGSDKNHSQLSEKKFAKLTHKLDLSPSQQTDIKALKSEARAKVQALKPAMKAFREQVKILMSADSFDEQAFSQLYASNQDVFTAMALIKAKSRFAMKTVLTEEQLKEFRSMKHKHSK